jgi:hypothetical protein
VDCFTDDIVYVEPADRQRYVGRSAVFELSGGDEPSAMSMTWHHLAFDPEAQIGFGEYTFRGRRQFHGVVIVQVRDDRIRRWREYQYHDELDWIQFIGDSQFEAGWSYSWAPVDVRRISSLVTAASAAVSMGEDAPIMRRRSRDALSPDSSRG